MLTIPIAIDESAVDGEKTAWMLIEIARSCAVIEIAPPWVRTERLNSLEEERAIPLSEFIEDAMDQPEAGADEILVGRASACCQRN